MIVLAWNCRGLGHPAAILFLCRLVYARRPDVIFLCETLSCVNKIEEIRVHFHYDCAFLVDCIGHSGGLCILWESANLCNLVNYSQNHVDLLVNDESGPWRFTGFYSFPEENLHRQSWNFLRQLAANDNIPLMCAGDFNDLL